MLHQGTSDFTVAAAWSLLEAAAAANNTIFTIDWWQKLNEEGDEVSEDISPEAAELLRKREYGDWSLEAAAGEL